MSHDAAISSHADTAAPCFEPGPSATRSVSSPASMTGAEPNGYRLALILATAIAIGVLVASLVDRRSVADPAPAAVAPSALDEAAGGGCWHRVRDGENLRAIARLYYGSGRLWRTIQVANDVGLHPPTGAEVWVPGHVPEGL